MATSCFLSFNYANDNWRVQQVRNIGAIDEQPILSPNKWEEIKKKGDSAVKEWVENNMRGKKCLIVLVGTQTSNRRWVKHEIRRACERGIGVFGVYIHNLKDKDGNQSSKGSNPFSGVTVDGVGISSYANIYDPPYATSKNVYDHIVDKMDGWISQAIKLRQ